MQKFIKQEQFAVFIEQPMILSYAMVSQHYLVTHQLNWGHNFKRGKPVEALSTEIVLVT